MSNADITLKNKVSTHIQHQLPEFIQADHPDFAKFVKVYYQFLESAEISFSEVNNYLRQETTSVNFVVDENDDKIVLEDSNVKFVVGETITGQTSNATATVLVDDVDDGARLFVSSQNRFIVGETVTGATSNSSGTISTYKANPISSVQQLLNYTNVDATLFEFLDRFRDSFLEGMVDNINANVNKRNLVKNIRDLYVSKGTKKRHELFFRLLLNEEPVISFPTDNLIRVSDGKWTRKKIMRVLGVSGNVTDLVGQTITGQTSLATAIPVSVVSFREANTTIIEIEIDEETTTKTFIDGETIKGTSAITDGDVSFTLLSVVARTTINDGGQYYTPNQRITVGSVSGSSNTCAAKVETINSGSVDDILIDAAGQNYEIGDTINFSNTGTDGINVAAEVQVVGGAITPESGSLAEYGMSATDHITLEPESQPFYNDAYDGVKIVLEEATLPNSEKGAITDIRLINGGGAYTKLPVVSSITTTNGSGANLKAVSTSGIGSIGSIVIDNIGFNYSTAPTFNAQRHAVIEDISGTFVAGSSMTSHTGTVAAFDSDRQLLSLTTNATLSVGDTVAAGGASGKIANIDTALLTAVIDTTATTVGDFLTEAGKISSDVMRIQDSFYYQDYSYVVKVGESIQSWRDSIRSTVHPAGWAVFGEVEVKSRVSARIQAQTLDSFTPELASLFSTLFTAVFGRRLGTVDDGTTLRANPQTDAETISNLTSGTRDVTLSRINTVRVGITRDTSETRVGSTLENLPKYAFSIGATSDRTNIPHYPGLSTNKRLEDVNNQSFTIEQFKRFKINEVSDTNGKIPLTAFTTRINVPPPGEIQISGTARINAFDNNFITFDSTTETFDETVQNVRLSSTTIKFDSSTIKFDGSGGSSVPRDVAGLYNVDFSDTNITFDSGINRFDNSFNLPVFERFDSTSFRFDNTSKKFDIGA